MRKKSTSSGFFFLEACLALALIGSCLLLILNGYAYVATYQLEKTKAQEASRDLYRYNLGDPLEVGVTFSKTATRVYFQKGDQVIEIYEK